MEGLLQECHSYSRYLTGQSATTYVLEKYREYHDMSGRFQRLSRFDRLLVAVSSKGPLLAKLADSYAVRFHKRAALRKKLVLMLALLECAPPASDYLDSADSGGWLLLLARFIGQTAASAAALVFGIVVFAPLHLGMTLMDGASGRASQ